MLATDPISIVQDLQVQLQKLKTDFFSGSFSIGTKYNQELQWKLYFRLGQISWVSGGLSASERWQRHIKLVCSKLELAEIKQIIAVKGAKQEYKLVAYLHEKNRLKKEKLHDLVTSITIEALFDAIFYGSIENHKFAYSFSSDDSLGFTLHLIEPLDAIAEVQKLAQEWVGANLIEYSPNLYPVIKKPELLIINGKLAIDRQILPLINGKLSLRGLAWHAKQNLIPFTQSLVPLIENRAIACSWSANPQKLDLSSLKLHFQQLKSSTNIQTKQKVFNGSSIDSKTNKLIPSTTDNSNNRQEKRPTKVNHQQKRRIQDHHFSIPESPTKVIQKVNKTKSVIACVDDSPSVCQGLKTILNELGYNFFGIQDPLQAVPILLERKPDFIFLDLIMPVTNGYELCSQLRKIPAFEDIPIIMLAVKNSFTDRIRAKMVHSNGFILKPARKDIVMNVVQKYLPNAATQK